MPRPTVLLFDIDGTLVTTGGVGRRALDRAFERRHGRRDACADLQLAGMTDRAIARFGLEAIGVRASELAIDELLEIYLAELRAVLASASSTTYRVHRGIEAALRAARSSGAAVGLGTGNIVEGARLKLERVGIYHHFEFGGFGSDHELRVELVRRGAERGAEHLGVPLAECRVVVIGDTPKDIDAARGIGAEAIGVGTASFSTARLRAHGATHAFDDLTAAGAIEALLEG